MDTTTTTAENGSPGDTYLNPLKNLPKLPDTNAVPDSQHDNADEVEDVAIELGTQCPGIACSIFHDIFAHALADFLVLLHSAPSASHVVHLFSDTEHSSTASYWLATS
ncbi:hypothetical protein IW262DRAFT_1291386 [Armillaria fumosa]|nr:hypothetical protein IW262DRAFT_1291386 [Armillaria fumosa]